MHSKEVLKVIRDTRIVAIMRGVTPDQALHVAEALGKAGIRAVEVTFNTHGAAEIINRLSRELGGDMVIGAGTVTNIENAVRAIEAGAEFVLAPNFNPVVISTVKKYGKLMVPGAFTATEVIGCHEAGADIIKIFPLSSVGSQYIRDLKGPCDGIEMMAVGGINFDNIADFLKAGASAVGIGSGLLSKDLIESGDYKGLQKLAERFVDKCRYIEGI